MASAANIITGFRILCSLGLLLCSAFSPAFYGLYIAGGISDMVDGSVARKTGSASDFGARLDTIADMFFIAACLIKLLPVLALASWVYVWIGVIALIKIINIISGFVVQGRFVALHSVMNKVTGGILFLFPLTVLWIDIEYSAAVVCAVASFAAIQEGHLIRTSGEGY